MNASSPYSLPYGRKLRDSGTVLRQRWRQRNMLLLALALMVSLGAGFVAYKVIYANRLAGLEQRANDTLLLQVETLNSLLEKPRLLPVLLGLDDNYRQLFSLDLPLSIRSKALDDASGVASLAAVRDILFLDRTGQVLGSVTKVLDGTRPFQPAVEAAMQGRLGRLFFENEGDTPFYVFAAPVRDSNVIIGVIVVEVYLNEVLAAWALVRDPVLVTDAAGRILFSNRPNLRNFTLASANDQDQAAYRKDGVLLRELYDAGPKGLDIYVQKSRYLPLLDWRLHALQREEPARSTALFGGLLASIIPLIFAAIIWLLLRRGNEIKMRQRRERAEAMRLERQVRDRTADLRHAQARLVQSAKLAAIGQLSATLAHEYNQPLAAIQAHAANAQTFLERGDMDKADAGLKSIVAMVRRMDELSRTLLSFARKPGSELRHVSLAQCVNEAATLVAATARQNHVDMHLKGAFDYSVVGGQVRFVQVFVNIFKNAIDALAESEKPRKKWVTVEVVEENAHQVTVAIYDNGPGIDDKVAAEMFDPFFTTKDVGQGLGIGLSIVYNILADAGADIAYEPNQPHGARFILTFQRAEGTTH